MGFVWQNNQEIGAAYRRVIAATTRADLKVLRQYEQAIAAYPQSISEWYLHFYHIGGSLDVVAQGIFPKGKSQRQAPAVLEGILAFGPDAFIERLNQHAAHRGFRQYDEKPSRTRSGTRRYW
jgi:hypothetical protein